ncbi:MAG: PIN domain-containing protein [Nocardioides sp.]|uniref:PIN domain-containing protein n=1 Tax=Nocardioides sp. TaxID=35761 RepID=UPI0039E2F8EA
MTTFLLDASVLIPLADEAHEFHDRVDSWISDGHSIALSSVTEGAMVRYLVRKGVPVADVQDGLRAMHQQDECTFWPDSLSYADADLSHVRGHRQVTGAYLLALAESHGARLVTLDEALAAASEIALLVP